MSSASIWSVSEYVQRTIICLFFMRHHPEQRREFTRLLFA